MAGLTWIELAIDLPRQDKSILLGRKIGEPTKGWTYRVALWLWAADQCPEGRVTRDSRVSHDADEAVSLLEFGMGWSGEPGKLFRACVECRIIDVEPDAYVVHGWAEYAAAHVAKKRKDAERQRKRRADLAKRYSDGEASTDVTRDSRGRPGESRRNRNKNRNKNTEEAQQQQRASDELPGVGGGERTGPNDDAARVNAAGGGESPAASDGEGAPGAADRLGNGPRRTDALRPGDRRLGLISPGEQMARPYAVALHALLAEAWPGIAYAAGESAVALDRACQERGGTAAFAVVCREFAARKGVEPGSTAWFAKVLPDLPKPGASPKSSSDIRVGVAAPAPASRFVGGERELG
jgi:hypothetical protein